MSSEHHVKRMIEKFEHKVEKDENVKEKVKDLDKTICIDLGEEKYSFHVINAGVEDYKAEGNPNADIIVTTTPEHFEALITGELRPMKAYVTRKISIKGKIDDILHLKSLF